MSCTINCYSNHRVSMHIKCNMCEYADMHTFFCHMCSYVCTVCMATVQQYQTYKTICTDIHSYIHTDTHKYIYTLHSAKQSVILRFHVHLWSEAAYNRIYAQSWGRYFLKVIYYLLLVTLLQCN